MSRPEVSVRYRHDDCAVLLTHWSYCVRIVRIRQMLLEYYKIIRKEKTIFDTEERIFRFERFLIFTVIRNIIVILSNISFSNTEKKLKN
jgi:hypothetical protein